VRKCDTPFVIGLYGSWGIGKTSLMRLVEKELANTGHCVRYDAWAHQFDAEPAVALLHEMVEQLGLTQNRRIRKSLRVIGMALGGVALARVSPVTPAEIARLSDAYDIDAFEVREARTRLKAEFCRLIDQVVSPEEGRPWGWRQEPADGPSRRAASRRRIVFFIDDLDRCTPEAVLNVLEAIKIYLNLPDCVYFLAVDREMVERSVTHRYGGTGIDAANYMEKIVQLPFDIPPIATKAMEEFIRPLLPSNLLGCLGLLTAGLGANPRQVKRFINGLIFNDELARAFHLPGYKAAVLAALLLIQHRDPPLYKRIEADPALLLAALAPSSSETLDYGAGLTALAQDLHLRAGLMEAAPLMPDDAMALQSYIYLATIAGVAPEEDTPSTKNRERYEPPEADPDWRRGPLPPRRGAPPGEYVTPVIDETALEKLTNAKDLAARYLDERNANRFDDLHRRGVRGTAEDVDVLMAVLDAGDIAMSKSVDAALSDVRSTQGLQRMEFYLFNGSKQQRNFAALFFRRRGNMTILLKALQAGAIDRVQALAR
jgi:hypothetical protein